MNLTADFDKLIDSKDRSGTWANRVMRLLVELQFASLTKGCTRDEFVSRVRVAQDAGVKVPQSVAASVR